MVILLMWYWNIAGNDSFYDSHQWTFYHTHRIHMVSHLCVCEGVWLSYPSYQMISHNAHTYEISPLCESVHVVSNYCYLWRTSHTHHRRMISPLYESLCVVSNDCFERTTSRTHHRRMASPLCVRASVGWDCVCVNKCMDIRYKRRDVHQCEYAGASSCHVCE